MSHVAKSAGIKPPHSQTNNHGFDTGCCFGMIVGISSLWGRTVATAAALRFFSHRAPLGRLAMSLKEPVQVVLEIHDLSTKPHIWRGRTLGNAHAPLAERRAGYVSVFRSRSLIECPTQSTFALLCGAAGIRDIRSKFRSTHISSFVRVVNELRDTNSNHDNTLRITTNKT